MATINAHQKVYLVLDATPRSELADVLSETTLAGLAGRMDPERNPTVYTDRGEAEVDARRRLLVAMVARRLADVADLARVEAFDADGERVLVVEAGDG